MSSFWHSNPFSNALFPCPLLTSIGPATGSSRERQRESTGNFYGQLPEGRNQQGKLRSEASFLPLGSERGRSYGDSCRENETGRASSTTSGDCVTSQERLASQRCLDDGHVRHGHWRQPVPRPQVAPDSPHQLVAGAFDAKQRCYVEYRGLTD